MNCRVKKTGHEKQMCMDTKVTLKHVCNNDVCNLFEDTNHNEKLLAILLILSSFDQQTSFFNFENPLFFTFKLQV